MDKPENKKSSWHRWFGDLFKVSLIPLGLEAETEYPVMKSPPEADVVIIRRKHEKWTEKQLERLPDGIRSTGASHVILELKYTESVNDDAICQTAGYYIFYKRYKELKDDEIQCFLVSSKTPRASTSAVTTDEDENELNPFLTDNQFQSSMPTRTTRSSTNIFICSAWLFISPDMEADSRATAATS